MEEEAEKLKQLQSEVDKQMNMGSPPGISKFASLYFLWESTFKNKIVYFNDNIILIIYLILASPLNMSLEDKMEVDNRSIYVGNVSST